MIEFLIKKIKNIDIDDVDLVLSGVTGTRDKYYFVDYFNFDNNDYLEASNNIKNGVILYFNVTQINGGTIKVYFDNVLHRTITTNGKQSIQYSNNSLVPINYTKAKIVYTGNKIGIIKDIFFASDKLYQLDVDEFDLELNSTLANSLNVGKQSSNFSKSFNIINTPNNHKLLNYLFLNNQMNSLIYASIPCQIKSDGFLIEYGYINITEITKIINNNSYKATFYSTKKSIFDEMKKLKLSDLNYSDVNHTLTHGAMLNTFNYDQQNYKYALIDFGQNLRSLYNKIPAQYHTDTNEIISWQKAPYNLSSSVGSYTGGLITGDLFPCLNIQYLMKKIISYFGYTYDSKFLDNQSVLGDISKFQHQYLSYSNGYVSREGSLGNKVFSLDNTGEDWKNLLYFSNDVTLYYMKNHSLNYNNYKLLPSKVGGVSWENHFINNSMMMISSLTPQIDYFKSQKRYGRISKKTYVNVGRYENQPIDKPWVGYEVPEAGKYSFVIDKVYMWMLTGIEKNETHITNYSNNFTIQICKISAEGFMDKDNLDPSLQEFIPVDNAVETILYEYNGYKYIVDERTGINTYNVDIASEYGQDFEYDGNTFNNSFCKFNVALEKGDIIIVKFLMDALDGNFWVHSDDFSAMGAAVGFKFNVYADKLTPNTTVDFKNCVPDMYLADFFNSIISQYNLFIDVKGSVITIDPFEDFYVNDAVRVIDITDKVDMQTVVYKNNTDLLDKKLNLTYDSDSDFWQNYYENVVVTTEEWQKKYGSDTIAFNRDPRNSNPVSITSKLNPVFPICRKPYKEKKVQNSGTLYDIKYVPTTNQNDYFQVLTKWSSSYDKEKIDNYSGDIKLAPKPSIGFFDLTPVDKMENGLILNGIRLRDSGTGNYYIPVFNSYYDSYRKSGTYIEYAPYYNDILDERSKSNNSYEIYWKKYINSITNKNTMRLTIDVFLSAKDIHDINLHDTIFFDGCNWLIEIITYNASFKLMSKMTLIKKTI
jgi:hypothetical protein